MYFSLFFIANLKSHLLPIWDRLQYSVHHPINLADFTSNKLFQWGDVTSARFIKCTVKVIANPRSVGAQTFFNFYKNSSITFALYYLHRLLQKTKGSTVYSIPYFAKFTKCPMIIKQNIFAGKLQSICVAKARKYPRCNT